MATKNIVPRAAGEGSLGIPSKPWGAVHVNSIPLADTKISIHDNNASAHANGISGNAATATKLKTPVNINGIKFDGTRDININLQDVADIMTAEEAKTLFNNA